MYNINVVVKPDETVNDIIEQICLSENIEYDDPFAFSAIMVKDSEQENFSKLKINCIEPVEDNPFTPLTLIKTLFEKPAKENGIRYVVAPLEQYLSIYKPMLLKMVNDVYPHYKNLIPDKEDIMSILYLTIVRLNHKGYYLHNHLIRKSFINELNMEVRKSKYFENVQSLDAQFGQDEEGSTLTLGDQLPCPVSTEIAREQMYYTEEDYWQDMFEEIRAAMLEDMSQLSFDRIMIQIKSKTIETSTSRILSKYRQEFNPGYIPRPNRKGGNKK